GRARDARTRPLAVRRRAPRHRRLRRCRRSPSSDGRRAGRAAARARRSGAAMTRSGGYRDRSHGGHALAAELSALAGRDDVVVLALPRGGVPVAAEVARALGAPLDAFVVRKLGVPGHEELAFGAVASGRVRVLNDDVVGALRLPDDVIERVTAAGHDAVTARESSLRGDRPLPALAGRIVLL